MIDNNKISQVFAAITENGIDAFSDEDLIKLLSMLNRYELVEFEDKIYQVFYDKYHNEILATSSYFRLTKIVNIVLFNIKDKMINISNTNLIDLLNKSLLNGTYNNYISKCSINDLSNIKFYLYNNANINDENNIKATKKLLNIIINELKTRVQKFS